MLDRLLARLLSADCSLGQHYEVIAVRLDAGDVVERPDEVR